MKFNKNEFGWKEKVSVNTNELATKNDIPHYNETLKFEISGEDYKFLMSNLYFNMSALNIDETKSYIGKVNIDIEYTFKFVYNKEADALMDEVNQMYIYNHKSYNGTNFIEDENSAVITNMNETFAVVGGTGGGTFDECFRLYEVDKVELDTNCLPKDVNIPNSLTVGTRIGDIGIYSVAEGEETTASGNASHAEGGYTTASGVVSHAEGSSTTASGDYSHAEGDSTEASGEASHAEGGGSTASGEISHAEGDSSISSNYASHAEGGITIASGYYAHTEGYNTMASSYASHAEGDRTIASGDTSHAEGKSSNSATSVIQDLSSSTTNDDILTAWDTDRFSLAKGVSSHVEGKDNLTLGDYSHAEGYSTIASGYTSHVEGYYNTAIGECSHAEGYYNTASGNYSHAEGHNTTASGDFSHAEGESTIASSDYQHVQGKYNIVDTSYAHIVGNGIAVDARSNAHTLDWNGNAWYSGKLSQDGTPTEDKDLTTKKYVDDAISNILSFNDSGELVVTINGVSKTFVPKQ